jgi:hypothetical protein
MEHQLEQQQQQHAHLFFFYQDVCFKNADLQQFTHPPNLFRL